MTVTTAQSLSELATYLSILAVIVLAVKCNTQQLRWVHWRPVVLLPLNAEVRHRFLLSAVPSAMFHLLSDLSCL